MAEARPERDLLHVIVAGFHGLWFRRLLLPVGALFVFTTIASLGYWLIEPKYTLLDAVYMTVITIGTVGYGEVEGPLSTAGRMWTIGVILTGTAIVAVALSGVVAIVVEGQVRAIFGRRTLQRKIGNLVGHVIVCGYGRMGALVATKLAEAGKAVVVVDTDAQRTAAAEQGGLLYVLGDAQEDEILAAAGVERAEALITALDTDAENVFVTLSARQANPKLRIICRAQQLSSEKRLRKAGATHVICPQVIGAGRMAQVVLQPAVVDFVEMTQTGEGIQVEQARLRPDSPVVGKTIRELRLPARLGIHIAAVQRADGSKVFHPTADLRLAAGDTLILIGKRGSAEAMEHLVVEESPEHHGFPI